MVKQNTGKWFRHGSWWKKLFLNRRYKDVLFRRLFRDKKCASHIFSIPKNLIKAHFAAPDADCEAINSLCIRAHPPGGFCHIGNSKEFPI